VHRRFYGNIVLLRGLLRFFYKFITCNNMTQIKTVVQVLMLQVLKLCVGNSEKLSRDIL
jgi:hypothetical protein